MVFVSTDCDHDLSSLASGEFYLKKPTMKELARVREHLRHPNVWYLSGKYGGCSCHFRHLMDESTDLGFGVPEEWFPADAENVESTKAIFDALAGLVNDGCRLDLVDFWCGGPPDEMQSLVVSLGEVQRTNFRFFEGYRFAFRS